MNQNAIDNLLTDILDATKALSEGTTSDPLAVQADLDHDIRSLNTHLSTGGVLPTAWAENR